MPEPPAHPFRRTVDWLLSSVHPLLLIVVIGLVVRLAVMPLIGAYDSNYWAVIVRNLQAGEGLYGLEGYYYTPVWGYMLGALSAVQTMLLGVGELGTLALEALQLPAFSDSASMDGMARLLAAFFPMTAMTTDLVFNFSLSIMLFAFDIAAAYLVYRLVSEMTGDRRKAVAGFALVFLCPLIILTSSVDGMFDTVCIVMTLLSIMLLRRGNTFLAGAMISLAVLTKFFPLFICPLLLAYVIARYRGTGETAKHVLLAFAGIALVALAVLMPQILEGDVMSCFRFLTDRVSSVNKISLMQVGSIVRILVYALLVPLSLAFSYLIVRRGREEADGLLLKGCLMVFVVMMLFPAPARYLVFVMPFLVFFLAAGDRGLRVGWILISLGAVLFVVAGCTALLTNMAVFAGMPSIEAMMAAAAMMYDGDHGAVPFFAVYVSAAAVQYLGLLAVVRAEWGGALVERVRARSGRPAR
ncbi:MAG: DUF2029 domain-containing protein [Euryarchaeota archaeon]|nr:DUF2029 domain-containing protein [Euryarchaeota archaeon]